MSVIQELDCTFLLLRSEKMKELVVLATSGSSQVLLPFASSSIKFICNALLISYCIVINFFFLCVKII